MAYSSYGGYAYRNGKRVDARSDCVIDPKGDTFGSPGMYPGFAAFQEGGYSEYERRQIWPRGHAVLGDGPIYVTLYKQTDVTLYKGPEKLEMTSLLKGMLPEAIKVLTWGGEEHRCVDVDLFVESQERCVFEVDSWKLEVFWLNTDNYYQYAQLTQPNGVVWHGFSGYGVGAGFEEPNSEYSTQEQEDRLWSLFDRPKQE